MDSVIKEIEKFKNKINNWTEATEKLKRRVAALAKRIYELKNKGVSEAEISELINCLDLSDCEGKPFNEVEKKLNNLETYIKKLEKKYKISGWSHKRA